MKELLKWLPGFGLAAIQGVVEYLGAVPTGAMALKALGTLVLLRVLQWAVRKWGPAVAAIVLVTFAPSLAAQETPQRHMTAAVTLRNGHLAVWSVDSGGGRQVFLEVAAAVTDSVLGHPRGGRWRLPTDQVAGFAVTLLRVLRDLEAGAPPVDVTLTWPAGPVRTAVVRGTPATGFTLTVTNRTAAGTTRAGSWSTSPRFTSAQMRDFAHALQAAALHDSQFMFSAVLP